jgi:hypothetical protein
MPGKKDKDYVEKFEKGLKDLKRKAPAQFEQQTEKKVEQVKKMLQDKKKDKKEKKEKKKATSLEDISKKVKAKLVKKADDLVDLYDEFKKVDFESVKERGDDQDKEISKEMIDDLKNLLKS